MKKILFALLLIASISPAFAQSVKFGISGGLNESTIITGETPNGDSWRTGFNAGVFSDISFGNVSIQPGLFYTAKGGKDKLFLVDENAANGSSTNSTIGYVKENINYLQLPVNILFHIKSGSGKFFIGGGPYVAYGLSCSSSYQEMTTDGGLITYNPTETNTLRFGSGNQDVKRVDFGLNALGGYTLKSGLLISAGFEYGLTNIVNVADKEKNDVITISVGYTFK